MGMPKNLLLVRHGQSESNVVQSKLKSSEISELFTPEFLNRHESEYRLSEIGIAQAIHAGKWIIENFDGLPFDRMYVSSHIRAKETAGHLGLSGKWYVDFRLRERDGGLFNAISPTDRNKFYRDWQRHAQTQPFLWRPPQGESIADVALRVKNLIETLCRECDKKNVILVCHGHVIRAVRMLLERALDYNALCNEQVWNCSIWHYTRINPGQLEKKSHKRTHPYADWMRVIDPTSNPANVGEWKNIIRPHFTSEELLKQTENIPYLKK